MVQDEEPAVEKQQERQWVAVESYPARELYAWCFAAVELAACFPFAPLPLLPLYKPRCNLARLDIIRVVVVERGIWLNRNNLLSFLIPERVTIHLVRGHQLWVMNPTLRSPPHLHARLIPVDGPVVFLGRVDRASNIISHWSYEATTLKRYWRILILLPLLSSASTKRSWTPTVLTLIADEYSVHSPSSSL